MTFASMVSTYLHMYSYILLQINVDAYCGVIFTLWLWYQKQTKAAGL